MGAQGWGQGQSRECGQGKESEAIRTCVFSKELGCVDGMALMVYMFDILEYGALNC